MLVNVSFRHGDSNLFYEYMNLLRPGSYNVKRIDWLRENDIEITTVEIDGDEALALQLAVPVKVTRLRVGEYL